MKIIWSDTAKNDYNDLLSYIAEQGFKNANIVQNRVDRSISFLSDFKLGSSLAMPNHNSVRLRHYIPKISYFFVYEIRDDDIILLLAFIHSSRDWDRIFSQ
jgi:plasmid stabilization system protein ParE